MLFIVTGASSGIGFAVAKSLAMRNNDVIAVARNTDRLESLKNACGDRVQLVSVDLLTETGRNSVVKKANVIGKVDGIVHAAGSLITPAEYQNLKAEEMIEDLNIHVTVPISINNALEGPLAGGRILYIDSYSASNLRIGWSGYSIVKAAAQMAARAAAEEITKSTVIRVFPGAVLTPLVETVLSTEQSSPTSNLFKEMESNGTISAPDVVGEFIADILTTATDQQLEAREIWDFNNPHDRIF